MKSIKYEYGKYIKQADGSYKIDRKSNYVGLLTQTTVGFTYEVKSNKTEQIKVKNHYIYPNGKEITNEHIIETNALFGCVLNIHKIAEDVIGEMTFKVSFPENSEIKPIEQILYLYDGTLGVLFQQRNFDSATDKDISNFENKYNTSLCDDYKHFLKNYNGLYIHWWAFSDEFDKKKGAYQSDKQGFLKTHYPFYEFLSKQKENWDWIFDAQTLFGLGNKNPYLDMKDFYMQSLFYHNDLVKYAYPIGQDGGGNCIMQIAQGIHRGKLAMLDHEVSGAMIDWVTGETNDVYEIPPEKATVDGFLNDCFEYGGLTLYETGFDAFFNELIKKHEDLYHLMKGKYGK